MRDEEDDLADRIHDSSTTGGVTNYNKSRGCSGEVFGKNIYIYIYLGKKLINLLEKSPQTSHTYSTLRSLHATVTTHKAGGLCVYACVCVWMPGSRIMFCELKCIFEQFSYFLHHVKVREIKN